jgi:OOP family OmpA-OmpF porin
MKSTKALIAVGLVLIFLSSAGAVMAERETGTYTLTPFIGGYVFDSDQDLKDKPVYGAGFGFTLDKTWDLEGVFEYIDTESETGAGDVEGCQYRIDGLYHFMPSGKLLPYLAAGIGGITLDPDRGGSDTDPLVNYGAGVKYFLKENIALRGDVRHIISFGSAHNNLCYTLGLTFFFGGEKKKVAAPPVDTDGDGVYDHLDKCPETPAGVKVDAQGCPLDSDGDGVYDYLDQCPDTPKGVSVDSQGCPLDTDKDGVYDYLDKCPGTPAGVKVDAQGCPLDSDGDGVYDYQDQCPDTPAGVKVDQKGCPLDSDGDGVPDYLDQCPRTPAGATVNELGCWVCKGLEFDFDKWNIKPQYYPILDEAVGCMNQHPCIRVEIQGHTDYIGTEEYNQVLSEKRAGEVMNYFIKKGISKERLSIIGYGFSKPIASNETPEGRAMNRRVQLEPIY